MDPRWPAALSPYFREEGFHYAQGQGALHTALQVGYQESREVISNTVWTVTGSFILQTKLFFILQDFYDNGLAQGALRFEKEDPIDPNMIWSWRFVTPFVATSLGCDHLLIHVHLERIPATSIDTNPPTVSIPSQVTVMAGNDAVIRATAAHYTHLQWRKNDIDIPGENGDTLIIPAADIDTSAHYTVVAENSISSVESNPAVIYVQQSPPIFSGPIPNQQLNAGKTFTLDISGYFSGTVAHYSLTGWPPGFTVDAAGIITGTGPAIPGTTTGATVSATNGAGTATSNAFDMTTSIDMSDAFFLGIETSSDGEEFIFPNVIEAGFDQANLIIDWGDGSPIEVIADDAYSSSHIYANAGAYIVKAKGQVSRLAQKTAFKSQVRDLKQWGRLISGNWNRLFNQCENFVISASDSPDFTHCQPQSSFAYFVARTKIAGGFNGAKFNPQNHHDCSSMFTNSTVNLDVVPDSFTGFSPSNIGSMFANIHGFDHAITTWDFSNVTYANFFLLNCTLSVANYDATLLAISKQSLISGVTINFGRSRYTPGGAAEAARDAIIAMGWTIQDGGHA